MKKIGITILFITILLQAYSQEAISVEKKEKEKSDTLLKSDDETKFSVGRDFLSVEDKPDNFRIRIGNHAMSILESLEGGQKVRFETINDDWDDNDNDRSSRHHHRASHFRGHWAGVEWGFANYLTNNYSFVIPDDIYYMDLFSSKSEFLNINFAQQSIGLSRHFGLVTGLGLNWDFYRFSGQNTIVAGTNGVIRDSVPSQSLKKSKFRTMYLTVPLILEGQIRTSGSRIIVGAGVIGGVKLWSSTKMITTGNDKLKATDDFSMNLLRWGPTVRIGYGSLQIISTYYVTPLFKKGKGPGGHDLNPFEIGLSFTFNG
ncbi:MAG TPA: hypothetical protein VMT63_08765 [Bacteroidales bacterium]|nr:hypothetical protein [Bacteroidales bacterium]